MASALVDQLRNTQIKYDHHGEILYKTRVDSFTAVIQLQMVHGKRN